MRLSRLVRLFSPVRYRKLKADFRHPVRALWAAAGISRKPHVLVTASGARFVTDRGDAPIWEQYFDPTVCRVTIRDGRFRVAPHDPRHSPYEIEGATGGLTYRPQRWNPAAHRSPLFAQLEAAEQRICSQHGEDGVLAALLRQIPCRHRYVVEFGAGDGVQMSNSRRLIRDAGWRGLLIEADKRLFRRLAALYAGDERVTTLNAAVTPENIDELFARHAVPFDFEVLSIDIDGPDYHVWRALARFEPRIVVIEYNASIPPDVEYIVEERDALRLGGTRREGASLLALYRLGRQKGYLPVYTELAGANLFFLHDSCRQWVEVKELAPEELYQPPQFGLLAGGPALNGRGYL